MPLKLTYVQSKAARYVAGGQSNLLTLPNIYYILLNMAQSETASAAKERSNCQNGCGMTFLGGNGRDFVHPVVKSYLRPLVKNS